MAPITKKRQLPDSFNFLERRVRPRVEPELESESESDGAASSDDDAPSEEDAGEAQSAGTEGDGKSKLSSEAESKEEEEEDDDEEYEHDEEIEAMASQVSFGALARAQSAMGASGPRRRSTGRPVAEGDDDDDDDENDGDNGGSGEERSGGSNSKRTGEVAKHAPGGKPPKRSSKNAPLEVTSKKRVSRRRDTVTGAPTRLRPQPRDPRFFAPATAGARTTTNPTSKPGTVDEIRARRAYAFLDQYRDDEMRRLRESIADIDRATKKKKKTLTKTQQRHRKEKLPEALRGRSREELERERGRLARTLAAMESRRHEQDRRDRERELVAEHRRKEKELVAQGKRPFYLKKSEQRERLLADRFARMGKGQAEHAMARRQKKAAGRERRDMPVGRVAREDR